MLLDTVFDITTHSPAQTRAIGELLGHLLGPGDVVCLQGDLGCGKTCLVQGIGRGLHVEGTINSPTFVFISEHGPAGVGPYLYHVDLYRLDDPVEVLALGLEDYMYGDGVTVIEWADRAKEWMPTDHLWITLTFLGDQDRKLQFQPYGTHYVQVVQSLREAACVQKLDQHDETVKEHDAAGD